MKQCGIATVVICKKLHICQEITKMAIGRYIKNKFFQRKSFIIVDLSVFTSTGPLGW